jgi:hypothetical protein
LDGSLTQYCNRIKPGETNSRGGCRAIFHKDPYAAKAEQIGPRFQGARQGCEFPVNRDAENQYLVGADSRRAGYFLR